LRQELQNFDLMIKTEEPTLGVFE